MQLSGNWLAMRSGTTTPAAATTDDAIIIDIATSKLQQPSATTANLQLANTSWLVLKDKVSQYSSMVAVVQVAQDDLGAIASYLTQIQQGYDALAGMTEGSQAQTDQRGAIAQLELSLSDFIGRRSVTMSDISLISSPNGTFDDAAFKAIDIDPATASTDGDTFAILEVDLAEVLTSTHESSACPICQAIAAGQKVSTESATFDNLGVSAPRSDEAAATNASNVTGATTISASTASYVEAIRSGVIWNLSAGETLSYSYYSGAVGYDAASYSAAAYNAPLGASAISGANQTYLDRAFTAWDSAAAFAFEKVTESGTTVGELRSAYTTRTYASASSAAYAYYPNSGVTGGDIWYINDQATNLDFTPGGYGYYTALHEIGHALGLSHSFDGGSSTGATLSAASDIARNTVMTYTQFDRNQYWVQSGTGLSARFFYASTPGLYDVAAMEHLYGTNSTTNATNTVHQFADWTASSPLYFQTIVDTGGADTIDASAQTRSSTINLTPGTFSSLGIFTEAQQEAYWATVLGGAVDIPSTSISSGSGAGVASRTALYTGADNVGIAFSATIENAIGGAGADTITGNTTNNALKGNAGNDTIDGGSGSDTAVFAGNYADYSINNAGGTITIIDNNTTDGNDGTDTVTNTEFLEFADRTYDVSTTATAGTGVGAIASAVAGAAVAASVSNSSSSSSSSGGGGGGGFSGDTSTTIGARNFARWRAANQAKVWAAQALERDDLAEAHLVAHRKAAPANLESKQESRALSAAIEFANNQKSAVANLANELYSKSNLFTNTPAGAESLLNNTQSARKVASATADELANTSTTEKTGVASMAPNLVSSLLS